MLNNVQFLKIGQLRNQHQKKSEYQDLFYSMLSVFLLLNSDQALLLHSTRVEYVVQNVTLKKQELKVTYNFSY